MTGVSTDCNKLEPLIKDSLLGYQDLAKRLASANEVGCPEFLMHIPIILVPIWNKFKEIFKGATQMLKQKIKTCSQFAFAKQIRGLALKLAELEPF